MMDLTSLMDAVADRVKTCWPGEKVYIDYLPKDFERPSFALELQKEEWNDANLVLVRRTVTILLTGFVATDAYGDSSREALNERMEAACGLFARGYLQVGDRAIQVQTIRGMGSPDLMEVTLVFTWMDGRPTDSSSGAPLMENYELNITKE